MLTIIIVSWNVHDLLRSCLHSLESEVRLLASIGLVAKIIVVDSASTDGSANMMRAEFPQIELIACDENIGYVKANNLALRTLETREGGSPTSVQTPIPNERSMSHLRSQFVWLLNPDTVVHPGAMRTLVDFMQAHPRCGLCGPKLANADGSLQHGAFALPGLAQLAIDTVPRLQARLRDTVLDGRYSPLHYAGPPFLVGTPLGAAMVARVDAIRQVGLLDEGYEMYSEEIDWAARMHKAGWEVWCVPQAVVTHFGGASSSQASVRAERLKWQSRQRYFAKHYAPFRRWLAMRLVPRQFRSSIQ